MTVVFYRPEMSVPTRSFSPSSDKARKVVQDWQTHRRTAHCRPRIYADFHPVLLENLYEIHSEKYVNGVARGEIPNGFNNIDHNVVKACLYNIGSMENASVCAVKNASITCSPTSGFHHAGYDFGGGFCTFNGLAYTAMGAVRSGVRKVLILDLDYHEGNGTRDIIERFKLTKVAQYSSGESKIRTKADLMDFIRYAFDRVQPSLVLYQAGADMHKDDPLGGLLTTREMAERDRLVFSLARERNIATVWNLAGGYQVGVNGTLGPLLTIHRNTYLCSSNNEDQGNSEPDSSDD